MRLYMTESQEKLYPEKKEEMLSMYFGPDGMHYNRVRLHMDSCDFATRLYSAVEDEEDGDLASFDFSYTEKYMIPLLEAAQKKAGRKLKVMLSVWSPPAFMKTNGSRLDGGSLKEGVLWPVGPVPVPVYRGI